MYHQNEAGIDNEAKQTEINQLRHFGKIMQEKLFFNFFTIFRQPLTKYLEKYRYFTFHVIIASPHPPVQCCCSQFSHRHARFTLQEIINMNNIVSWEGGKGVGSGELRRE